MYETLFGLVDKPQNEPSNVNLEKPRKTDVFPVSIHLGDIHCRTSVPEYRKEKGVFCNVIAEKLLSVFDCADTLSRSRLVSLPIFISGDLFDKARDFSQWWFFSDLISKWDVSHERKLDIYAVRGQHDMHHHNPDDTATSFNALVRDNKIQHLSGACLTPEPDKLDIRYYGRGWGEEYPVPKSKDDFNVLILHETLWHKETVFPGQTDGNISVESVKLKKLGYDMVFSGDNHKAFDTMVGGVQFHNLGAFTRNAVDLVDQQPRFCVLYSDKSVESVYVGKTDVFDLTRSIDDKDHVGNKDEFSEALAGGFTHGDTFEGALERTVKSGKCGYLELSGAQLNILRDVGNNLE